MLLLVSCAQADTHDYSECRVDDDPVYYELVEVRVNGEPVPNGVRAPELLLRKQSYADLGLLINGDTDDPPVDTGDDLGLDLWQSQVIYVRQ